MNKTRKLIIAGLTSLLLSCGGGGSNTPDTDVVVSSERIEVSDVTMLPDAGEKQVTVNANCSWVISVPGSDTWLSVNPTSGTNTQTITLSCSANTSTNSRTSVVTISGKQRTTAFKVTQNGIEVVNVSINNFNLEEPTSSSIDYSFTFTPVSSDIKASGVCYSITNNTPTTDDIISSGTRSGGTVVGKISSLSAKTTYYIRAFVTNSSGTYYSQVRQATTASDAPGRDDNDPPSAN